MELDHKFGAKPLYSQLYEILLSEINSKYSVGDIIPPEPQLIQRFHVSRATIRKAIEQLCLEGFLEKKPGLGTVVLSTSFNFTPKFISSFSNGERSREVISIGNRKANKELSSFFGIPENTDILEITKIAKIENKIVTIYYSYLHPDINIEIPIHYSGSFYKLLEKSGNMINSVQEEITAFISTPQEKNSFIKKDNFPVLKRIRKGFSNKSPIEYTISFYDATNYTLFVK